MVIDDESVTRGLRRPTAEAQLQPEDFKSPEETKAAGCLLTIERSAMRDIGPDGQAAAANSSLIMFDE